MPFTPGFNLEEAKQLMSLCAAMEEPTPPLDPPPFPANWTIIFDSGDLEPFDNRWQLVANKEIPNRYAIVIRGTVNTFKSILADLLAVMVRANGSVDFKQDGKEYSLTYQMAETGNDRAGVHLGFTIATLILMYHPESGILSKLMDLPANSEIFVAGHSQGAAIATLCRSLLNYPANFSCFLDSSHFQYKTYLFAQPRPGNDFFANDFDMISSSNGMAFKVNNNRDWIPQVPITFESPWDANEPNPLSVLASKGVFRLILTIIHKIVLFVHKKAHVRKHMRKADYLKHFFKHEKFQQMVCTGEKSKPVKPEDLNIVFPDILGTLNFVNCGSPYILKGVSWTNPDNPDDSFWQHHPAMYYYLLAGKPVPKK